MNQQTTETLFYDVTGQSMWPFLRGVERVVVQKTSVPLLRQGDLVVFRSKDKVICHRFVGKVMRKDRECLAARPDTTWQPAEIFDAVDLLGRVVGIVRRDRLCPWTGPGARLADIFFFSCGPFFRILR
jgi:hypothetical protein